MGGGHMVSKKTRGVTCNRREDNLGSGRTREAKKTSNARTPHPAIPAHKSLVVLQNY